MYSTERMVEELDAYATTIDDVHFFQWHLFGSQLMTRFTNEHGRGFMLDFDGVLCEDCPVESDDDGVRYLDFIKHTKPIVTPRPYYVHSIATARLSKYREETEKWLRKYNIKWGHLFMGKWKNIEERRENYDAGAYKGTIYLNSECGVFIESCPVQARQIFEFSKKPVICSTTGEVHELNLGVERLITK